jgi:hypothetical protein
MAPPPFAARGQAGISSVLMPHRSHNRRGPHEALLAVLHWCGQHEELWLGWWPEESSLASVASGMCGRVPFSGMLLSLISLVRLGCCRARHRTRGTSRHELYCVLTVATARSLALSLVQETRWSASVGDTHTDRGRTKDHQDGVPIRDTQSHSHKGAITLILYAFVHLSCSPVSQP